MVTYSVEEDRLLLQLRYELSSSRGPDCIRIKNRFDTEFSSSTHKKYTIAMLRNRLARIDKSRVKKKARNRCGICGELLAGHTCKRLQEPAAVKKVTEKVIQVATPRKGARTRVVKRASDFSYRIDDDADDLEDDDADDLEDLDMELPTEAELSEAFLICDLPPLCLK